MIARVWCARTTSENWIRYDQHFTKNVVAELQAVPGYVGAQLLKRLATDGVEVTVVTFWQSWEAIGSFAGPDREAAVVAPEVAALLTEYDRRVRHHEVAYSDKFPAGR